MKNIIEAQDLPLEDKVYLKKDFLGWRIVNPIKNPDGSRNWSNILFGGNRNLMFLLVLLLVVAFALYSYNHDIKAVEENFKEISDNPLAYCERVINNPSIYYSNGINLTDIQLNE